MLKKLGDLWCRYMHGEPMLPMHRSYVCRECLRSFPVKWEKQQSQQVLKGAVCLEDSNA